MRRGRLNIDPDPGASTTHMIREISLAMINNNRPRHSTQRGMVVPGAEDEVVRDPVIREPLSIFLRRGHHLVEHIGNIPCIGRNRCQPQPHNATTEQINGHRQLNRNPPPSTLLQRENIQRRRIQQHILTRILRPQPPIHPLRPLSNRPTRLPLTKSLPALRQLIQTPVRHSLAGEDHRSWLEFLVQCAPNTTDNSFLRGC